MPWPSSYGSEFSRRHTWSHRLWKINKLLFYRHMAKVECSGNLWNICLRCFMCERINNWLSHQLRSNHIEFDWNLMWPYQSSRPASKTGVNFPEPSQPEETPGHPQGQPSASFGHWKAPWLELETQNPKSDGPMVGWLENGRPWGELSWYNGL